MKVYLHIIDEGNGPFVADAIDERTYAIIREAYPHMPERPAWEYTDDDEWVVEVEADLSRPEEEGE